MISSDDIGLYLLPKRESPWCQTSRQDGPASAKASGYDIAGPFAAAVSRRGWRAVRCVAFHTALHTAQHLAGHDEVRWYDR